MASLYGDLPPPETEKSNVQIKSDSKSTTKTNNLYNFTPIKSTVKTLKKPIIPAGWTTHFKPAIQRKPVINKPKTTSIKSSPSIYNSVNKKPIINNPNIPAPTIISSEIIKKTSQEILPEKNQSNNDWLSSTNKRKQKKKQQPQKKAISLEDIYDPKYPNEYEVYKREKKMKKRMEKERRELERQQMEESHHHHHHRNASPPIIPAVQPLVRQPAQPINLDISGEEAFLMRARLSAKSAPTKEVYENKNTQMEVPGKVVLLTNLVGAGEVDDTLQEETADECKKYGVVERCLIYEVKGVPDKEAVRIFIKFMQISEAIKAHNDLNGRYFGGRIVKARYFDESRFNKLDLAPRPGEI